MNNNNGGKGDKRIPSQVPNKQFADNWELAFGKKSSEVVDEPAVEVGDYVAGDNWLRDTMRKEDRK